MDKKRSVLNVSVSMFSRAVLLFAALYVRRLLIRRIGNDVNGLNSLYASIIGMLSVAELGVGSAIVYSMYSPIVSGNTEQVAALYCLYKKLYRIIGAVIFAAGLALMPFLPLFISDYDKLNVNVYGTFFLTLVSVVISYLYSAKTSLIEAHKDNYLTTGILTVSRLARFAMQAAAVLIWQSYAAFLACQILETLLIWGLTEAAVRHTHGNILVMRETVDDDTKSAVGNNVKAMFMHKIGTILVMSIDNMIISGFIGVAALGRYANYSLIAEVVSGTIGLFFSPLTSIVGHLCAAGNPEQAKHYFNRFYCLNYILGAVFFLGYCACADSVVTLCFGPGLDVSRSIIFIITLNQFTKYMRRTSLLFRDASGAFYNDRWKPVSEGVANLILSLLFVNLFPENYRIVGVIVATIITTLLICHVVEPYVVFHHVFGQSPRSFCLKNYAYIALFASCAFVITRLIKPCDSYAAALLVNGFISLMISAAALILLAIADKDFRAQVLALIRALPASFRRLHR
ncbi:MAG: hypothetical protein IJU50_07695 [Lachnospiraceae bacterium]|nr:hypothetical protein [Lachnospiraceae bacterium]